MRAWAGSPQISVSSPLADPDRQFVYATSPNGLIHKLSLSNGSEDPAGAWPVSITHDATHEKLGAALNIDGRRRGRRDQRLLRRCPHLPGPRHPDRPRERAPGERVQHAVLEPTRADRAQQLLGQRLGDPLAGGRGDRAGRGAHADRHRKRALERAHELRRQRARAELSWPGPAPIVHAGRPGTPEQQRYRPRFQRTGAAGRKPRRGRRQGRNHARALALAPERALCLGARLAGGGSPEPSSARRRPAVQRAGGVAQERAHDDVRRRRKRDGRIRAAPRQAVPGMAELDPRNQPGDGRGLAVRVRPFGRAASPSTARARRVRSPSFPAKAGTGTARSSSTGTWSSPRATATTTS